MKCTTCGKRFKLLKKNRYEVVKRPIGFNSLTYAPTYYNAFDCPRCGCQNIVGEIIKERNDEPVPKIEKPEEIHMTKEMVKNLINSKGIVVMTKED